MDLFSFMQLVASVFVPDEKTCSPCEIPSLKSLNCDCTTTTINCENRRIQSLPSLEDGCVLNGITEINFANNDINSIKPDAFKGLQVKNGAKGVHQLKLDLSSNQISSISEQSLPSLAVFTHLDLSDNQLETTSFRGDYSALRSLKELDVKGNSMDSVPHQFCQMSHLKSIHVQGNPGKAYRDISGWSSISDGFWEKQCNSSVSLSTVPIPVFTVAFSILISICISS